MKRAPCVKRRATSCVFPIYSLSSIKQQSLHNNSTISAWEKVKLTRIWVKVVPEAKETWLKRSACSRHTEMERWRAARSVTPQVQQQDTETGTDWNAVPQFLNSFPLHQDNALRDAWRHSQGASQITRFHSELAAAGFPSVQCGAGAVLGADAHLSWPFVSCKRNQKP